MTTECACSTTRDDGRRQTSPTRLRPGASPTGAERATANPRASEEGSSLPIDLAEVVAFAVELNRARAAANAVRLHFFATDQAIPFEGQLELLEKLDMVLRSAVRHECPGATLMGLVDIRDGEARVALHSACGRHGAEGVRGAGEVWSWPCTDLAPGEWSVRPAA